MMDAGAILGIIGSSLEIALKLANGIGDVVTAKKVKAILDEGKFPGFPGRALAAGEAAKSALEDTAGMSTLDDRQTPSDE